MMTMHDLYAVSCKIFILIVLVFLLLTVKGLDI